MLAVIEINDIALRASTRDKTIASPAFAYVGASELVLGDAALELARRHPRQTLHQFWQRLDTNPLAANNAGVRHHADIAYQQLLLLHRELGSPDDVMFVLPASFSKEQMALLLGLAQQCPFKAVAIVDYGVASLAAAELADSNTLLELQLHQSVAYQLEREQDMLVQGASRVFEKGYMQLLEQCANLVAKEFVAQCRFDPLHDADTEQQLFAAVHENLQQDAAQYSFDIHSAGRALQARVEREQLDQLFVAYAGDLRAAAPQTVTHLGANLAAIPGLRAQFPTAQPVAARAAADQCLAHADTLRSYANSLAFTTTLPYTGKAAITGGAAVIGSEAVAAATEPAPERTESATHYVIDACAYPLPVQGAVYLAAAGNAITHSAQPSGSAQLILSVDASALTAKAGPGFEFIHNGVATSQARVQRGDSVCLEAGGKAIDFIQLVSGDAQ